MLDNLFIIWVFLLSFSPFPLCESFLTRTAYIIHDRKNVHVSESLATVTIRARRPWAVASCG